MFLCIQLTGAADHVESPEAVLLDVAQQCSPRVASGGDGVLFLDLDGLERLFGTPRAMAETLRRTLAGRGLRAHLAAAGTRTAARLLASARAGVWYGTGPVPRRFRGLAVQAHVQAGLHATSCALELTNSAEREMRNAECVTA